MPCIKYRTDLVRFFLALAVASISACSVGGNDPNPADGDGDSITDAIELSSGLNPNDPSDADADADADGLSNRAEVITHGTDHTDPDTDNDGLNDGDEINIYGTDPTKADTDGDGLNDDTEVNTFGTNPLASDTDGDSINDGTEANGFMLFDKTTKIVTDPLNVDTDSDGIHDAIEKAVQDSFAQYGSVQNAISFLQGALHPSNQATKPSLNGLSFTDTDLTVAALELDPDGDGKPTIEELFHGTNPNDASSEFLYVFEVNAAGDRKPRFQAMDSANFLYVPGGWDVDGDGTHDLGFFIARFEAKPSGVASSNTSNLAQVLSENIVYNRTLQRFTDRLCDNTNGGTGTDEGTSDSVGACRGNKYQLAGTSLETAGSVNQVIFTPAGSPYAGLTWLQARLSLRESAVDSVAALGGPYAIDLPTELHALQIIRIVINNPENWVSGTVGTGTLFQGHSDNSPSNALSIVSLSDPYDQTENSATTRHAQRRTLVIANGIMARDFTLPLNHRVEIWDLSGNLAEWTLGLFAANHNTSNPIGRPGGDRFANGLSELENYTGTNITGPTGDLSAMPAWWKPIIKDGTILSIAAGAGAYNDGFSGSDLNSDGKSDGAYSNTNYGYGVEAYSDGFVAPMRGGHFSSGSIAGASSADLQNGLGRTLPQIGFRASALSE